jgi:hypothetical protein
MSYPLTQFARRFWTDETKVRSEFTCPFLVWEALSREHNEELWMGTITGAPGAGPRAGEPMVLPVLKGSSRANAFGMGITVGRTDNNDLVVPDQSVSRFHAYFQQDAKSGVWKLTDAESKNGTFIDGTKMKAQEPATLQSGQQLRFGEIEMKLLFTEEFFAFVKDRMR